MLQKPHRIGVALAAAVMLLAGYTAGGQKVESLLLALGSRLMAIQAQDTPVAVIAIDAPTLATPWSRARLARAIDRLARLQPKAIGLMLPLSTTETPAAVAALDGEIAALRGEFREQARDWLRVLDSDARLAESIRAAGNVVLSGQYHTAATGERPAAAPPVPGLGIAAGPQPWPERMREILRSAGTLTQYRLSVPVQRFLDNAAGIGFTPAMAAGARVSGSLLAIPSSQGYLPGFELALWALHRGQPLDALSVSPGRPVRAGENRPLGTLDHAWYPRPSAPVPVYSLQEVMQADSGFEHLRGAVLLVGPTSPSLVSPLVGPRAQAYTPVTWSAQVLSTMLADNGYSQPAWFYVAQRTLIVLAALYLALVPVGWHRPRGLAAVLTVAVLAVNAGLITLIVEDLWLPVLSPAVFLVAVQALLTLQWYRRRSLRETRAALLETRLALAGQLQSQGRLDDALTQYLACLPEPAALPPLYDLGLDFERHRQVAKARTIFERLRTCGQGFRDSGARSERLAALSERFPSVAATPGPAQTLVLDTPVMERPVLGRYRVERELGQGAMGTVYLAVDPTIGREVAIKTLPLLKEFEGAEQEAVAKRFFKEAEAVGRLSHPHIVTVFDAGREHDLAYMAMDYVPGTSLEQYTAKAQLLPVWEVLEIIAQVADALDYAHRQNVVHRDIKPGNILYDRDNGVAKLGDFGVARLLDNSRTRTGTVLGSPSYMSPEQVAGKQTDGRSDLFSLGVTLYQLLSGSLPFAGDSVATLMYQIANQKTPSLRKARSGLPVSISRLVNKVLQKNPASRFKTGAAMAEALRKSRAQFRGGRRKTA